ncbi:TPR end-of-group domain-containing protein [Gallaecimonas sp. GXIMD1310]|uniref:tetratricopeptide repeat protein n=1 Tax=Gallaecimonas sp. GXIMD1310 TaxID=3131926 RepID=UPI0032550538
MRRLFWILPLVALPLMAAQPPAAAKKEEQNKATVASKRSNLPPLMERYILDELKSMRMEMADFKISVNKEVTQRDINLSERAMSYSSNTVSYFFYLIAGGASLLALVGWQSLRDIKRNTKKFANEEITRLTQLYENRLKKLEQELRRKTSAISDQHREIEKLNDIHSLWLKASQDPSPQNKIEIYDEILSLRPGDLDALTHKADAALMMGERRWALSICNKVLAVDHENAHALYQRACAWAGLNQKERALSDLTQAIELSEALKESARDEEDFDSLQDTPEFQTLVEVA